MPRTITRADVERVANAPLVRIHSDATLVPVSPRTLREVFDYARLAEAAMRRITELTGPDYGSQGQAAVPTEVIGKIARDFRLED